MARLLWHPPPMTPPALRPTHFFLFGVGLLQHEWCIAAIPFFTLHPRGVWAMLTGGYSVV